VRIDQLPVTFPGSKVGDVADNEILLIEAELAARSLPCCRVRGNFIKIETEINDVDLFFDAVRQLHILAGGVRHRD